MPVSYRIYSNDGLGGAVDYAAPIATTAGLAFTPPPLAAPSDTTFAVRAIDMATGLEEANTDARVRIIIDPQGRDVSRRPNAPHALALRATAGGGCRATWAYSPAGQGGPPDGFHIYLTPGSTPDYSNPSATIPYLPGKAGYSWELGGLDDGSTYSVAVRAYNAAAIETNTGVASRIVADAAPPGPVESLSITPVYASD